MTVQSSVVSCTNNSGISGGTMAELTTRHLISFKALGDTKSDMYHLKVEAHYINVEHMNRRVATLEKCRSVQKDSLMCFEYLANSFSWTPAGISARFVVDMELTKLKPLRDMLY